MFKYGLLKNKCMVVKVGLIGCGMASQREILPRFPFEKDKLELVAVCDTIEERAKAVAEMYNVKKYYVDYHDMLDDPEIDAILNVTPIRLHYQINREILEAGKHLYTQKPLALTVKECDELINLMRKKNLKVVASPGQMLNPLLQRLKKVIKSGVLGKLCVGVFASGGVQHEIASRGGVDPTWYYKKPGGGPLYDFTVYTLHTMTGLLGPAKRVSAFSGIALPKREWMGKEINVEVDDNTVMLLDFGNASYCMVNGTNAVRWAFTDDYHSFMMFFTKGAILGTDLGRVKAKIYIEQNILGFESGWFEPASPWRDEPVPMKGGADWIWADILHLVDCIENDKKPIASAEHARHVIDIIESAYISAQKGSPVELRTSFEEVI